MELRKITKSDKRGKRLFIEIGKRQKHPGEGIPDLKIGGHVMVLPQYKLTEKETHALLGKYISFLDMDEGATLSFEGVVALNKIEYYDTELEGSYALMNSKTEKSSEYSMQGKYVLLNYTLEIGEATPIYEFDNLNHVFDLKVHPDKLKLTQSVKCTNHKCQRPISITFKYCPHCKKQNANYQKG